jgi:hypothetical protein
MFEPCRHQTFSTTAVYSKFAISAWHGSMGLPSRTTPCLSSRSTTAPLSCSSVRGVTRRRQTSGQSAASSVSTALHHRTAPHRRTALLHCERTCRRFEPVIPRAVCSQVSYCYGNRSSRVRTKWTRCVGVVWGSDCCRGDVPCQGPGLFASCAVLHLRCPVCRPCSLMVRVTAGG